MTRHAGLYGFQEATAYGIDDYDAPALVGKYKQKDLFDVGHTL